MSAGALTNLPDLIIFCVLFDAYVYRESTSGPVAVRPNFVYLARREEGKRITLTSRHVSLEHLNRTCAAMLNLFAAAVDGQLRPN